MFDLNQASEGNVQVNYQTVGIHDNIVISEVVLEQTSANKVDYMRLKTQGADGAQGTSVKMFLGTEVKEGKKTSGWGVTARNLVDLIKSTHNVDEATAKGMVPKVNSKEELVDRIAALLVGKPFRAKYKGRTTEKGTVIAELAQVESMRVSPSRMTFNAIRDVAPFSGTSYNSNNTTSEVVDTTANDGLPF
jgi:hypothetical protein